MLRTIITPQNNTVSLTLPDSLIGRKVEVIAFAIEEAEMMHQSATETKIKPSQMRSFLSAATAEAMQQQIDDIYFKK